MNGVQLKVKEKAYMRTLGVAVAVLMVGALSALAGAPPPSPGLITFEDDFGAGPGLDPAKWSTGVSGTGPGIIDYDAAGNPGGSLRVETTIGDEAFGRPNIKIRPPADGWVTEFDFKLDSSAPAGDYFIVYAAYGPHASDPWPAIGPPIDVEIGLGSPTFTSPDPVDLTAFHGGGTTIVDSNLAWDQWYHFTIHRTYVGGAVDLYIDGAPMATFSSANPSLVLGGVQVGDVSNGNFTGIANWDNFLIGTVPEPASLSLILFAGLLLRGLRNRRS